MNSIGLNINSYRKMTGTPVVIASRLRAELVIVEILRFAEQILRFLLCRWHHSDAAACQFPLRTCHFSKWIYFSY